MDFAQRSVLVTGGAQGLGRAIVEKFLSEGATVFVLDKAKAALDTLKKDFPTVTTIQVDLLDWKATQTAIKALPPLHHLVNNAGIAKFTSFLSCTEQNVDLIFGVNFKAALNVGQVFAQGVIANGILDASIVNISSNADRNSMPGAFVYCCTKAALTMLTKCMAQELGPHSIRVNCVRPAAMKTAILDTFKYVPGFDIDKVHDSYVSTAAIKRTLETSEVADLVLFLSSKRAAMITGEDVAIDGGFRLG